MSENENISEDNLNVDYNNLYREEAYTDLKVASIRKFIPVKPNGSEDKGREPFFVGQTQIMSPSGPLPIQCPIDALTLKDAIKKFPEAIQRAIKNLIAEAKQMQREEESRIVLPNAMPQGKIKLD